MTGSSESSGSSGHVDLLGLARGELATDEVLEAGEHLRRCEPCRAELVEVAVGHAVLTRARRTLSNTANTAGADAGPAEVEALPPLVLPLPRPGARHPRRAARLLLSAAVVALVAVVGGALALSLDRDDPSPDDGQVTALEPVDDGTVSGEVRIVEGAGASSLTITAADLPEAAAGSYYQAWLLDPASNKMLALGPLAGDLSQFQVDADLLAAYGAVDVSLESDDGDPSHSVESVLRGAY